MSAKKHIVMHIFQVYSASSRCTIRWTMESGLKEPKRPQESEGTGYVLSTRYTLKVYFRQFHCALTTALQYKPLDQGIIGQGYKQICSRSSIRGITVKLELSWDRMIFFFLLLFLSCYLDFLRRTLQESPNDQLLDFQEEVVGE